MIVVRPTHPPLAIHDAMGLATDAELAAVAAVGATNAAALAGKQIIADPLRPISTDGAVVAVPGMTAGAGWDAGAVVILGVLGDDLYLIGSQADPVVAGVGAGALAGVWRRRDGVWTSLGTAPRLQTLPPGFTGAAIHNYNRLEEFGAVAFNGALYLGDRHQGKLYRLDLNLDGSLSGINVVGQVGNEDIFLHPSFGGRMPMGTFGAIGMPADMPKLYSLDRAGVVAQIASFDTIGNQGYVNSIAAHGGYLWIHVINVDGSYGEMWRMASDWSPPVLMWSGARNHKLVSNGSSLFAVEWRDVASVVDARWVVWRDGAWVAITDGIGAVGNATSDPPFIKAVWAIGDKLYCASHYYGIFELAGQKVSVVSGAPPRVQCIARHDDRTWIMGVTPVTLYEMRTPTTPTPPPSGALVHAAIPGSVAIHARPPAVAALPIANSALRGQVLTLLGNGVTTADVPYQCRRNAGGIYEWVPIAVGSPVIPLPGSRAFHFSADAITGLADAAAVASWADNVAGGTALTQATGAKQPTYRTNVVNAKPVVRFDGVDDFLQRVGVAVNTQPMTTILVAKLASVAALKYLMDGGGGLNTHVIYGGAGPWGMVAGSQFTGVGPTANTAWHILVARFATINSSLRVDGGAGTAGSVADVARTGLTLGAAQTGILPAPLDLAEALSYDRQLSLDEINAAGTSLAAKYAIPWTTGV